MHPCPSARLLTDDGAPSPELSTEPAPTLAELTAAKILLFVLIDGWNIVVRALMGTFH